MIQIGLTDYTPDNKIINIKDKNGVIKAKYAIDAKDILKYTLMSEHYIEISFELNRSTLFKRSDYIEWEGDKYTLRSDYKPEQINKRKYQYTLKFEALEMFFQDIQYYYLNQGLKESEWRLTGNPGYFIQIAVDNINRYFGTTSFMVGTIEPTEIKDILFDTDTNTFDALTQIADEYGAEWYITGKTIHLLNKVSFGSEVDFETEVSVLSMKREEGDAGAKYTRIVALGSTRNIPNDYRATSSGEAVDAIYSKRLRIPVYKGDVINAYPNMLPDEVVEGTVIFDEVYPKRIGTIEAVGTIEYTDTDQDTGEQTKWNAYKFKDSGINFKEEYVLPGQELKLSFQSGDLNGRDFALIFHEKGFSDTDNSQYFEIVRTDEYGKELPNDIMKPKPGDKYVLYGFNIALVSDQYVPEAELELYDTALAWLQKQLQDTDVYECASVIKYFMDNLMDLAIGQKVRLVHEQFDTGYRSSRIMGFEKKLNNKYDAIYTVGDNSTYSRFGKIEKDIKELQHAGIVYENTGGGNGVYVIKQFDTTRPTDFNVYSAAASDAKYFNKQTGGTVSGDTIFQKNMQVQGIAVSDVFQNSTFTAGQLGSGFQIKRDANGQSYMEIDNLLVRREAVFNRLTIAEIKSVGGTILLSLASMVILKIEDNTSTWKCYFDNDDATIPNDFAVGDQAICRKFTGKDIKYYWALVTAVGADYIELSKTDKDGSGSPGVDDEVVQLGNRTDVNRQSAIMLSAYGSDTPSIKQYAGINSYDMTGKEVTAITPKGNKFTGSFIIETNGTTAPIYKDLGLFENGRVYYLNDRVSHLGSYWVCIVDSTIQIPHEESVVWRKDTAGTTDINSAVDGLRTETSAEFEVLHDEISSKVSQTDFNALGQRVSTAESEILQIPNKITLAVTENKEYTNNTVDGLRTETNASIEVLSGQISSKVSQADFNALGQRVSTAESEILQIPDKITLAINKIQVGGRNYVLNSKLKSITDSNTLDNRLIIGQTYTLSIERSERVSGTDELNMLVYGNGAYGYIPVSDKKQIFTFVARTNVLTIYASNRWTGTNRNNIYNTKLEIGNKATDWTPAPEDVEEDAQAKANASADVVRQETTSQLTILSNQISSKVSQSDFNALGQRVSTAESNISQMPDKITVAVNNIQIGGRNYVLNSQTRMIADGTLLSDKLIIGQTYTLSIERSERILGTGEERMRVHDVASGVAYGYIPISNSKQSLTFTAKSGTVTIYATPGYTGTNRNNIYNTKLEIGNKATDWTPAPEDVQSGIDGKTTLEEVSSSFTITANKISLASKEIELNGDTIAKAIQAQSLNVGDNFLVGKDGIVNAKGANIEGKISTSSSGKRVVIDPDDNSIKMYNENGRQVASLSFVQGTSPSLPSLKITEYIGGNIINETVVTPSNIWIKYPIMNKELRLSNDGLTFYKNGSVSKSYPSS